MNVLEVANFEKLLNAEKERKKNQICFKTGFLLINWARAIEDVNYSIFRLDFA